MSKEKKKNSLLIDNERKYILNSKSSFYVREAYNTLRTNLGFALAEAPEHKVILVTSSQQTEGKSITSLNLAISLAESGKRVIIIDADLRKPKLSRLVNVRNEIGLSNVLVNPDFYRHAVVNYHDNIDIIFSGKIPPNPSELLGSKVMEALLEALRKRYDYVIIDTPPINMVTDAVVVAPKTDGVLFIVRSDESQRGEVNYALDQLEYANAKVLGFVLNGVALEDTSYAYKKYKRYGYKKYYKYGYKKYGYGKYGYGKPGYGYGNGYGYGYGYGYPQGNPEAPNPGSTDMRE